MKKIFKNGLSFIFVFEFKIVLNYHGIKIKVYFPSIFLLGLSKETNNLVQLLYAYKILSQTAKRNEN